MRYSLDRPAMELKFRRGRGRQVDLIDTCADNSVGVARRSAVTGR